MSLRLNVDGLLYKVWEMIWKIKWSILKKDCVEDFSLFFYMNFKVKDKLLIIVEIMFDEFIIKI